MQSPKFVVHKLWIIAVGCVVVLLGFWLTSASIIPHLFMKSPFDYSNMAYTSNITIDVFVIGASEVANGIPFSRFNNVLADQDKYIEEPDVYLVLFLSNTGDRRAWGTLEYRMAGRTVGSVISLPSLDPTRSTPRMVIVPIDAVSIKPGGQSRKSLLSKLAWRELYTE